jgi:hypothetical protein
MVVRMEEDPIEDLPDDDDDDDDKRHRRAPGWVFPPVDTKHLDPTDSPYVDASV